MLTVSIIAKFVETYFVFLHGQALGVEPGSLAWQVRMLSLSHHSLPLKSVFKTLFQCSDSSEFPVFPFTVSAEMQRFLQVGHGCPPLYAKIGY